MHNQEIGIFNPQPMTDATFRQFSTFIQQNLGIKMPDVKKTMLQTRLQRRMRCLKIRSYDDYHDFVFNGDDRAEELQHMINNVTTNKTDFFREPKHFDFLSEQAVPDLLRAQPHKTFATINVWSAGCSSGEEPYTIAMMLSELAGKCERLRFSILATDISTAVLKKAIRAVYPAKDAVPVPERMKKKYLMRSKNRTEALVRIVPELRSRVQFRQLNLMADDFGMKETMDIIFCRNVLIYFKRPDQEKIVKRLCRHLNPEGFLFLGHSETLNGMVVPLSQIATTVYQKKA